MPKPPLPLPHSQKPYRWIVFKKTNQQNPVAALIRTSKDLAYYRRRTDITASVMVWAFNRTEAWLKGKALLESNTSR